MDVLETRLQECDEYIKQMEDSIASSEQEEKEPLQFVPNESDTEVEESEERTSSCEENKDSTSIQEETEDSTKEPEKKKEPIDDGKRRVYLTFDDGPSEQTKVIMDILDEYGVKGTFFVTGREDEASKKTLQEIVNRGHSLALHSYSHNYREIYASKEAFVDDFQKIRNYVYETTGVDSKIYRFPGGSSNAISDVDMLELIDYLETEGVTHFDWNVSSGDGSSQLRTVDEIVKNCTSSLTEKKNAVILLHDMVKKTTSVEALPTIIEYVQAMENTLILPITEDTVPVQHVHKDE